MKVIVGGVIEKDDNILLVQEAQERCYGKWNIPAGHLDFNETIMQGAIREIKEETGCDVELTGVVSIQNRILEDDIFITIIFSTKLINENIKYDKNEILDVKWYDYNDIINNMDNELRDLNFIKRPIINLKTNNIAPIEVVNVL